MGFISGRYAPYLLMFLGLATSWVTDAASPLPSWRDDGAKARIVEFVKQVTREGSDSFVPPGERIAVFDNDGTLWSEKPMYFQMLYTADQVKRLFPEHPEWKTQQPFASILNGNLLSLLAQGSPGLEKMLTATHAGMSTDEFQRSVAHWIASAKNPVTGMFYRKMVFQPMLELLVYLRANGFKTYIVSGGGVDFLRVFSSSLYGIPPEQVIGSRLKARYKSRDGHPAIVKTDELAFLTDKQGKPLAINEFIGRRPVFAAGNSDGDLQMLEWTTSAAGPRFGMLIHHTDASREWAYDKKSDVGRLDKALKAAKPNGWLVVDMANDWRQVYPPEKSRGLTQGLVFPQPPAYQD
ncbi:haloacid dehalogenase-like hydrolase [Microbulbifer sp. OS29]|uniref:phosphoserine phosphatase n=1 Tax=Microbulbifer okhotskensis TaxID=2926617 RepID=A0A9X2ES58_9GAMM|nr:HAD family hydrolase [Microbulbifer okhotskensis]MCO1334763.1 haloacid dehalogenase-like hydrolase [Microbulbifer okhotskensis]